MRNLARSATLHPRLGGTTVTINRPVEGFEIGGRVQLQIDSDGLELATGVRARIQPKIVKTADGMLGEIPVNAFLIILGTDTVVRSGDQIVDGSTIYEVDSVMEFFTSHQEVIAQRINDQAP